MKIMTCHEPLEFVNGKQRCARCGTTISPVEETALDPEMTFCEGEGEGDTKTSAESLRRGAALKSSQSLCEIRIWSDVLKHVADRPEPNGQSCARCEEAVRVFDAAESLPTGAEYVIRYAQEGDGPITWSGDLVSVPKLDHTPTCVARS